MNTTYLDTLPEVKNKYKVNLEEGEKVVFTAKPCIFGTETGQMLGMEGRITMTNRRIIADNGAGVWRTDIEEDVVDMRKIDSGKFLTRKLYILVTMNKELAYGIGIQKLHGYQFWFHKNDIAVFEEIMRHMA